MDYPVYSADIETSCANEVTGVNRVMTMPIESDPVHYSKLLTVPLF